MVINKCHCASEIKKSRLEALAAAADNGRDFHLNASKLKRSELLISEMVLEGFCYETVDELRKTRNLAERVNYSESNGILDRMFLKLAHCFAEAAANAAAGPTAAAALECGRKNAA